MKTSTESANCGKIKGVSVEARGGIEPPNKGFADHSDANAKPLESSAVVDDIASRPNVGPIDLTDAYALMCFFKPNCYSADRDFADAASRHASGFPSPQAPGLGKGER